MERQSLRRRDVLRGIGGTLAASSLAGCNTQSVAAGASKTTGAAEDSIAVASKQFVENEILGYLALITLGHHTDAMIVDETEYGTTKDVWAGLQEGSVDLSWEYTGTLRLTHSPKQYRRIADPEVQYRDAKEQIEAATDLTVLERAPINNSYGLLASESWVERTGISTISGLADHVKAGNTDVTAVLGSSFYDRPDGWPGLLDRYGIDDRVRATWEESIEVVPAGLTYEFLRPGDVDIAMGFTTDPQITELGLQKLQDDRDFWPIYSPAPVVRTSLLAETPEIESLLDELGPLIEDNSVMRELNGRVIVDGNEPVQVARAFLAEQGLI
ncbi:MAG: glycine betaine ABC transporter substrate-binding protein [Halodesulfurarchaeum sp.]|nr:glycine betaine ABC transporter substrate-binding protein [Halodesulfurarchaeum sp.]